jgi:hypothetical protein
MVAGRPQTVAAAVVLVQAGRPAVVVVATGSASPAVPLNCAIALPSNCEFQGVSNLTDKPNHTLF